MARPEAHFRNRATLEKGKKQIRAANAILNPHGIWADRKRVSNHKPRKGTETYCRTVLTDEHSRFQITNPARGRKLLRWGSVAHGGKTFQITNPARGRKLRRPWLRLSRRQEVSNHKPRKGTETSKIDESIEILVHSFKSQTPQGDGNAALASSLVMAASWFQITNPARGRKQNLYSGVNSAFWGKFQITNPARGRKLCDSRPNVIKVKVFQITNPARGRKRPLKFLCIFAMIFCFKSQTPQGDGNEIDAVWTSTAQVGFQITNPARGRKLLSLSGFESIYQAVSNHKPRKGTETW